ncbi:VWA domain-containing protein, partial [Candidatus Woesearchaeota archaeon]
MRKVVIFDTKPKQSAFEEAIELDGKLSKGGPLANSVLKADEETIKDGNLLSEAIDHSLGAFTPDLLFEKLVTNYQTFKNLYGEKLIRYLTDYDPSFLRKNMKIPELQRELKERIIRKVEKLKDKKLLENDFSISDKAFDLAAVMLCIEELDHLKAKGLFGEREHKREMNYGDKTNIKEYRKGDPYRNIAIRKSTKIAIRRGHKRVDEKDLRTFERKSKGNISVVYALDASASMKGRKLSLCKKAGIALAYKAITRKDKVGLIIFGSDVKKKVEPTLDFQTILKEIARIKASRETNIAGTIKQSIPLFHNKNVTKHLILVSDALPTVGQKPEEDTLRAV